MSQSIPALSEGYEFWAHNKTNIKHVDREQNVYFQVFQNTFNFQELL